MVLGSQFGCVYIDEINTANIDFVREISTRNDTFGGDSQPRRSELPVYSEFINRSRPYKKYAKDVPQEILDELTEEPVGTWRYWFFSFRDNLSLTDDDIKHKMLAAPKGTKLYMNKILGLRGRVTGLAFNLEKHSLITLAKAKELNITRFTAALDTSYSQNSDDTFAFTFGGITSDKVCCA